MNETGKVLSGFFAVVAGIIAALAWTLDPTTKVWLVRVISTTVSLLLFTLLLRAFLRKDLVPDYLRMISKSVFERSGFQFLVEPITVENHYCFRIWYQNRHANHCSARILLTPQKNFLMKIPKIGPVLCETDIPAGGFGYFLVPLNTEKKFHGKRVSFGVYADTKWRDGKGEMLRFKDGTNVGTLPGTSRDQLMNVALFAAGAGSTPSKIDVKIPFEVAEVPTLENEQALLWKQGDTHHPFDE